MSSFHTSGCAAMNCAIMATHSASSLTTTAARVVRCIWNVKRQATARHGHTAVKSNRTTHRKHLVLPKASLRRQSFGSRRQQRAESQTAEWSPSTWHTATMWCTWCIRDTHSPADALRWPSNRSRRARSDSSLAHACCDRDQALDHLCAPKQHQLESCGGDGVGLRRIKAASPQKKTCDAPALFCALLGLGDRCFQSAFIVEIRGVQ